MFRPVIIIPCFNHATAFAEFAKKIVKFNLPVIVVDDGSEQKQSEKLQEICTTYTFIYTKNTKNRGKGGAMITGFKKAAEHGFSHAVQIDADGQHNPDDIARFLELAKKSPDSLIVGQPLYDSSAPKSRLIGRKITKFWVMVETLNKNMPDTMCGFRVYPIQTTMAVLQNIKFLRMGFDIEIIVKLYRMGVKIVTTDTKVIYPESGVSHFHVLRDNFYISLLHMYLCCGLPFWLLKKLWKKIIALFVFCACFGYSADAKIITEMPDRLKTFTNNLDTVSATFVQSKTMAESVKTFKATGHVKFVKGKGFKWVQEKPKQFDFTSTLDSYCINGTQKALNELPYFTQVQAVINDVLNGDITTLSFAFNVDYSEIKKSGWILEITPKFSGISDFLQAVTISGNATDLNQILIMYKNGTNIVVDFKRMTRELDYEIKC